jgi:hypothetical protein
MLEEYLNILILRKIRKKWKIKYQQQIKHNIKFKCQIKHK